MSYVNKNSYKDSFFEDEKIYVHYGTDKFEVEKFRPIRNKAKKEDFGDIYSGLTDISIACSKPRGGFWGSPLEGEYTWDKWRKREEFGYYTDDTCIKFKVKGNVYVIDSVEKALDLADEDRWIDWEEVFKKYDAVEFLISKDSDLYHTLYGWDVDSIVVGNPYAIEIVE